MSKRQHLHCTIEDALILFHCSDLRFVYLRGKSSVYTFYATGVCLIINVTMVHKRFSKEYLGKYLKISCWVFPVSCDITHFTQDFSASGEKYLDFLHLQSKGQRRSPRLPPSAPQEPRERPLISSVITTGICVRH